MDVIEPQLADATEVTPAATARSATNFPTTEAASMLPVLPDRKSFSRVDAEATTLSPSLPTSDRRSVEIQNVQTY